VKAGPGSLARRVLVWVAVLSVGWLTAMGLVAASAVQLRSAQVREARIYQPAERGALQLLNAFVDQQTGLRGYLLTGQERYLKPYTDGTGAATSLLLRLQATARTIPDARQALARVEAAHQVWQQYATEQIALVRGGHREEAVAVVASAAGKSRFGALRESVASLQGAVARGQHDNQSQVVAWEHRLIAVLVLTLAVLALVVTLAVRGLLTIVIGPVQTLAHAARAVADGDLSVPIPVGGAQEISAMGADVAAMRDRLMANAHAAERALAALEQGNPAVAALRQQLVPVTEQVDGLVVTGRIDPAEGVLGGDWYDLIALSAHRAALLIGDVAGHGPASAVFALRLKHALGAALRAGASPAAALALVSRTLHDVPDELFATVLAVTIDTATDQLVYANAGHPAPLLLSPASPAPLRHGQRAIVVDLPNGSARTELSLPATGPVLSSLPGTWSWGEAVLAFSAGDSLLAFTDGLLEARDEAGEQFGLAPVRDALTHHDPAEGARLVDALAAAVLRHGPTRLDDQTLLHVYRPTSSTARAAGLRPRTVRPRMPVE
jgi:serine phosphatase RsbU (regulator of sigma subunit)/CHASE3 domain sensor protein